MSRELQGRTTSVLTVAALVTFLIFQAALRAGIRAATCSPSDPSAAFSTQLSLPPASTAPWVSVREAILHGEYKQAENDLNAAPASRDRWFWQGVLLLHERRTFDSIRSLEEAARLQDDSSVETLLATDYFLLNQRILAREALNRALQLAPHDAVAFYLRGRLDFVSDSFDKAAQNFATVLAQEPNDYHSLYYLGFSEWRMGLNSRAREHLEQVLHVLACHHLSFSLAPYTLAQIEFNAGDAAAALDHSNLALNMAESARLKNRDAQAIARILTLRGKIDDHLRRPSAAQQDLESAVRLNPYLVEGWYLLARVYREQGKRPQADAALKQFEQVQSEL